MAAIGWLTQMDAAIEEAKRTHKPVLVDIYKIPG